MMLSGLYLITDDNHDGALPDRVAAALRGGVRIVQYRDKQATATERLTMALRLVALCHQSGAILIINDDAQLAHACNADGVHLGQKDGEVAAARALLGPEKLIGVSTRTVAQAQQAAAAGADYIGLGSLYPTTTKGDAVVVGVEGLRAVRAAVALPIVAIGGIARDNAGAVINAGADCIAVVSAVMSAPRPELAAKELTLLFNRRLPRPQGRVLTIAGSDSGGGAGIQADLKTITLLGSYGMSAITALTAQNTCGVSAIHAVPPDFVDAQLEAVLSDIGTDTIKTGMLLNAGIIAVVAAAIQRHALLAVVDPVMIAKGGAPLLQDEAIATLRHTLIPQAYLLTPNLPEAEALTGLSIGNETEMERAARALQELGAANVLLKGGHLEGGDAIDLLLCGDQLHRFVAPRITTTNTHGTGCTFAAAIATFLAQGWPLPAAVGRAKSFLTAAIASTLPLGSGHGPVNHWQGAKAVTRDL
ncbi:MAG: bifunctional hydroxymethylpyrimidine kinase/phosphomethylpyrimidine kinase [Desulfuromonadales bacterium]|nr:bifunctional hydroxymethylpyrimidine kinase/phosphomethylpyrimidine kinase [Desulfuromonadales bacterium]